MVGRWGGVFGAEVRMAGTKSRGSVGGLSSQALGVYGRKPGLFGLSGLSGLFGLSRLFG